MEIIILFLFSKYIVLPISSVTILYRLYIFLFAIYGLFTLVSLVRIKKIHINIWFCFVLSLVLYYFSLCWTKHGYIDARPPATFRAFYGGDNNILIATLTLILCYVYFKKITQSDIFGFLVFSFLFSSFLFFQCSISWEYFLIQWIFVLHFFILFTILKNRDKI